MNTSLKDYHHAIEFIDYISLFLESGHHIQEAFLLATMNLPEGNFRLQCFEVIKWVELGFSFGRALMSSIEKNLCPIARDVFESLSISLKLGTKVSKTLAQLSAQFRLNMIARLEALAHEAPIKMIFPLVIFIFPVIFTLLGTKTFLNFLQSLGG